MQILRTVEYVPCAGVASPLTADGQLAHQDRKNLNGGIAHGRGSARATKTDT
jgi:hypothetical protein